MLLIATDVWVGTNIIINETTPDFQYIFAPKIWENKIENMSVWGAQKNIANVSYKVK